MKTSAQIQRLQPRTRLRSWGCTRYPALADATDDGHAPPLVSPLGGSLWDRPDE